MLKWHGVFQSELIIIRDSRDQSAAASRLACTHTSVHTKTNTRLAVDWSRNPKIHSQDKGNALQWGHDGITVRYDTGSMHHGTEGRGGEVMENRVWQESAVRVTGCCLCLCVVWKGWWPLVWWVWSERQFCILWAGAAQWNITAVKRHYCPARPDATHQQIHAIPASQRPMLHPLAAWGEDVGARTSRGLHVGQTERTQVFHTLLHLQLITQPC